MNSYFFQSALLPDGWQSDVRVETTDGRFVSVTAQAEPQPQDQRLGCVIPQMPNAHSHVFQRAMAGLSEYKKQGQDNFWSWRDLMYQLANQLDAEQLYQVAKSCYQEMQSAGYAAVCEFHYVHRSADDASDFLSHSRAILQAAKEVGMSITLLPVLYAFSAVGEQPLTPAQQRFALTVDEYVTLFKTLGNELSDKQKLGICFHSIRAVNQQQMQALLEALPADTPVHIHIAEQQAEIEQSVAHYGLRPVEWLYQHFKVDSRWCLVHATHLSAQEVTLIAESGAVVGICPLTEANLGDGVFPMQPYMQHQGRWAIGSDSHIEIQPQQELKMLEYSQRLVQQQRNVCCDDQQPHVGTWMWLAAVAGGQQACQQKLGGIQVGMQARIMVLEAVDQYPSSAHLLDAWVFSDRVVSVAKKL